MKVLIYAPNYLPTTRYGGPVRSSHGLAKALVELGHEVEVFTTNADGAGVLDVPLDRPVELDGVTVRYFGLSPLRRIYHAPGMGRTLAGEARRFDVVHVNGVYLWPGPKAAYEAARASVPTVVSPRGMLTPEMVAGKSQLVKRAWIAAFERRVLRGASAIHVTSEEEASGVRRLRLDLAPVAVIPNGVEIPSEPPAAAAIEAMWAGIPAGSRVAMLGRLDWTKGVDLAIDAVAKHPHAQILIAGPDQIGLRAKLEPGLARAGRPTGRFVGELQGAEKWALLFGADVLLAPSIAESFGLSVAEALAVGTPVVCSHGVGASSIIGRVDAALVVPRTAERFSEALSELLADRRRRCEAGKVASRIMASEYTWRSVAGRMVELYAGVLGTDKEAT